MHEHIYKVRKAVDYRIYAIEFILLQLPTQLHQVIKRVYPYFKRKYHEPQLKESFENFYLTAFNRDEFHVNEGFFRNFHQTVFPAKMGKVWESRKLKPCMVSRSLLLLPLTFSAMISFKEVFYRIMTQILLQDVGLFAEFISG